MAIQERLYTADDLWNLPDDGRLYELHNGVLVEVAGSGENQSGLAAWIIYLLTTFIMQRRLGGMVMGADGTYVLAPYNTRIPDASYILPQDVQDRVNFHIGAPALAVEVVSPSNTPQEMQQRAGEYLNAGTRLIWIVDAQRKTIDVYRTGGERTVFTGSAVLDGYDVLPGLELPLETAFNPFQTT